MEEKIIFLKISMVLMKKIDFQIDKLDTKKKQTIQAIIDQISQGIYFLIHFDLNNNLTNDHIVQYKGFQKIFFDAFNISLFEGYFSEFEVEMIKFGKSIFGSNESRWALINYPTGIFSSLSEISKSTNFDSLKTLCKDKTHELLDSRMLKQKKIDFKAKEWYVEKKPFRLFFQSKKNKDKPFQLFFETEWQMNRIYSMLQLIKLNKNLLKNEDKEKFIRMTLIVEATNKYYSMIKFIELKNFLIKKKSALAATKKLMNENFQPFRKTGRNIFEAILDKYKEIKHDKLKVSFNKYLLKQPYKHRIKVFQISILKDKINMIKKFLKEKLKYTKIKNYKDQVLFKLLKTETLGIDFNIDERKFKHSKKAILDMKKIQIDFENNNLLTTEMILMINNLFLNLNLEGSYEENSIVINGPKLNTSLFFKYNYKKDSIKPIKEKFIEPEFFNLSSNPSYSKCMILLQIYHAKITLSSNQLVKINEFFENKDIKGIRYTEKDFYYFITIENNKSKAKSLYIDNALIDKSSVYVEFNSQFYVEINSNNSFDLSLYLVPKISLDEEQLDESNKNFLLDYLLSYELGYCIVRPLQYEYDLISDSFETNKLIVNLIENIKDDNLKKNFLVRKGLNVGSDVYYEEEIDYFFLEKIKNKDKSDIWTQESLWNINYDDDFNLFLKPPKKCEYRDLKCSLVNEEIENEEKLIKFLYKKSKLDSSEIMSILENKNYYYLPSIQTFNKKIAQNSSGLDEIQLKSFGYKNGDLITKTKSFKKYFMSEFLGIDEINEIYLKNYAIGEIKASLLGKDGILQIQENMFSVYDFDKIDASSIENFKNYEWSIMLKFQDKNKMNIFLHFLKDFRRKATLQKKLNLLTYKSPMKLIYPVSLNKINLNINIVKFAIFKIEFRNIFKLSGNCKLCVSYDKGYHTDEIALLFIEFLRDKNFTNSLLLNKNEFSQYYNVFTKAKYDKKTVNEIIELSSFHFNQSDKVLKFDIEDSKYIEFEVRQFFDKTVRIQLELTNQKEKILLYGDLNVESVFNQNSYVDIVMIPIKSYQDINSILGIINLNIFTLKKNENLSFDTIFSQYLNNFQNYFQDEHKNNMSLCRLEPNVYQRYLSEKILLDFGLQTTKIDLKVLGENNKSNLSVKLENNLSKFLKRKSIIGAEDLLKDSLSKRWTQLRLDVQNYNYNNKKKFFYNSKRMVFHNFFSRSEYIKFFSKLLKTKFSENVDFMKLFENFLNRKQLITMKTNSLVDFNEIKALIFLGLPHEVRLSTWDRILDIDNLVTITYEKLFKTVEQPNAMFSFIKNLNDKNLETKKKELYKFFFYNTKTKFSFVDSDLNILRIHGMERSELDINKIFQSVKNIAKSYLNWTELNLMPKNFQFKEFKDQKFIYFFGLLNIIYRLVVIFNDDCNIFWIICSFSQYFEMFYQSHPFFENLSFLNYCITIIKNLLESNFPKIHDKFIELNFPVEYFISHSIPALNSEHFLTELFLRLMDILIFTSALKTVEDDKYDNIKYFCSITLTIFEINERMILHTKSVAELEAILHFKVIKPYNVEKFIKKFKDNLEKFFLKSFYDFFEKLFMKTNYFLFEKAEKILNETKQTFNGVIKENLFYLKKKFPINGNNLLYSIEQSLCNNQFSSIKSMYSPINTSIELSGDKYYIATIITGLYEINKLTDRENKLSVEISFNGDVPTHSEILLISNLTIDVNGIVICPKFFTFENKVLPGFVNITLVENAKNLAIFILDLHKLNFMKPYDFLLESDNSSHQNKFYLKMGIIKVFRKDVRESEWHLFNLVFAKSNFINLPQFYRLQDKDEMNEITNTILVSNKSIHLRTLTLNENKFIKSILMTNVIISSKTTENTIHMKKYEALITNVLNIMDVGGSDSLKHVRSLIFDWLGKNTSSFEEIICALFLIDEESYTIYDKLKLIFKLALLQNSTMLDEREYISITKLKEIIFILYKRLVVNMTRFEVERMIDFLIFREKLINFRFVLFYNKKNQNEIIRMMNDKETIITKENDESSGLYLNITKIFMQKVIFLQNYFNVENISHELLQVIISNIPLKIDKKFNQLIIQYERDNIRITNTYHYHNKSKSIKRHKMLNVDYDLCDNTYKFLLKRQVESLELTNNSDAEIDFEGFVDLFFKLPFIVDSIRSIISHSFSFNKQSNKILFPLVKFALISSNYDTIFLFVFSKNKTDESQNFIQEDNQKMIIYNINTFDIYSYTTIHEITIFILKFMENNKKHNHFQEIVSYLKYNKLMNFSVHTINGNEYKINLYDPFYSLDFIKSENEDIYSNFEIVAKFNINSEFSFKESRLIMKNKGYAKLYNYDKKSYQWKEMRTENEESEIKKVNFLCLNKNNIHEIPEEDTIIFDEFF